MLAVNVRFSPGQTESEARLAALAVRMVAVREALRGPFTTAVTTLVQQQFATEGQAYGSRWAPLAESTRLKKIKAGVLDRGILVFTGAMRTAMLGFRPADWRVAVTPGGVSYDLAVGVGPYPFHHTGTSRMPARPVFPSPAPKFAAELRAIVRGFLSDLEGPVTFSQSDVEDAVRALKQRVPEAAPAVEASRGR